MKHLINILFILSTFWANAQVFVNTSATVEEMVKRLEGDGVLIENVTYSYDLETELHLSPVGNFNDVAGVLGMEKGLLITNGAAEFAKGPNNNSAKFQENFFDTYTDPDLEKLIDEDQILQDLVIIEFDITVYADELSFNYVFASEEYPEFLEFNDVFGFFLSGPGIVGVENLALIPGTNIPVSVSNINHNVNTQYYISNGSGDTPFDNPELQYDGFTTVLEAKRKVLPCETYHIKLAIADVDDSNVDSGVFLEEGSFSSRKLPHFEVEFEYERFDYLIEGCNDAIVNIVRDEKDLGSTAQFELSFGGTSTYGADYDSVPLIFNFSESELEKSFNLNTIIDDISDPVESIIITLISDCDKFPVFDIIEIPIREEFEMTLPNVDKCGPGAVQLNEVYISTDAFVWNHSSLSCLVCPSPFTDVLENTNFIFEVYDSISGCNGNGKQFLVYENIVSDFDIIYDECKTTIDFEFKNNSIGEDSYQWDFGDDNFSSEENPTHTYNSALNIDEETEFVISLTVTNSATGCTNTKREAITIYEPLYSPNVITTNNDLINDVFSIKGINEECWSFEVYNRWGKKVFEESPFLNNFIPSELTDGVYYYRAFNDSGDRELKGYFNLYK